MNIFWTLGLLDSIEWIFFWMNILDFVLNWILNWIIFRSDSMKKWTFKTDQFLFGERDFCQQGISPVCPGLQLSHSDNPHKNIGFWAMVIFRGSPRFLVFSGLCHYAVLHIKYVPFILDCCQQNLMGLSGPSKNDPQWTAETPEIC